MAKECVVLIVFSAAFVIVGLTEASVPAIFVLGDSTADVGTNNYLLGSSAIANFPPNGIDFPYSRPTGRFSNGLNSADFLAKEYGYKRSPPSFLSHKTSSSLHILRKSFRGINFASGGAGILDSTGQLLKVVPLTEQIQQFSTVKDNLTAVMGSAATEKFLSKSLFFISIGSNDLLSYYHSNTTTKPSTKDLLATLASTYECQMKSLVSLGAKKFGIIGVAPIGCCPSQRIYNQSGGCLEELNKLSIEFHSILEALLSKLSGEFKEMKYSLGNAYKMTMGVITNPTLYNLVEVKSACCGGGKFNGESICELKANLCSNRNRYLFWDMFHPTQAASRLAALTLFNGPPEFVAPFNFSQLAQA